MIYDLQWKISAMKYFLQEMKKRRDWHPFSKNPVRPPPQEGVTIEDGKFSVSGEAMNRWHNEAIFYAEAYLSAAQSFFDVLAKAFSNSWKPGQDLNFKKWIDDTFSQNNTNPFVKELHDFKDAWVKPLSDIRNPTVHEKSLARGIKHFSRIKGEKGKGMVFSFLVFLDVNGKELEIVDYLEQFDSAFDKIVTSIDNNPSQMF